MAEKPLTTPSEAPLESETLPQAEASSETLAPDSKALHALCEVVGRACDVRDGRRDGHARDAAFYARLIAEELKLSPRETERIELAALLHGLGKIMVPDEVLRKSTPLSPEELEVVRNATVEGSSWLYDVDGFEDIAAIIRHQGERWDGSGFPDALEGEAIPLGARILAVALRFAAMIRPRADRPALSVVSGALEFLAYEAGLALDPHVVRAFLAAMGRE